MANVVKASTSIVNKLPVPKRIRLIVFNALRAKGMTFIGGKDGAGVTAGVQRLKRLNAVTPGKSPAVGNGTPEFEFVAPSKASPLGDARVESKIQLQDLGECPPSFEDLGVTDGLQAVLASMGIEQPTPVQASSIPNILDGKDTAIQCYTGSGKTLAYAIPVLMLALAGAEAELETDFGENEFGHLQALIVAPSRELAMQIVRVFKSLLPAEAQQAVQQAIGGANFARQVEALREKPVIVVGTPGRLAEHSRLGHLTTHRCPLLVLDEVDQLMTQHFTEDMRRISEHCGRKLPHRETILVSATLTEAAIKRTGQLCPGARFTYITSQADPQPVSENTVDPVRRPKWGWGGAPPTTSSVGGMGTSASRLSLPPTLKHGYIVTSAGKRVDTLRKCIHGMDAQRVLVFMNFQRRLQDTLFKLAAKKMKVGSLHGEKTKLDRERTLRGFHDGLYRTLIVSDVAARGLDVEDCDAVFNLELPSDPSHYAHRAGRTGRMGRSGWVVSVVTVNEIFVIEKIAKQLGIQIDELQASGGELRIRGTDKTIITGDSDQKD